MPVRIRLRRMGSKKRPFYRVVVADSRFPRDGRFIENVGQYQPILKPARLVLKEDRIIDWINRGAQPSTTVQSLFRRVGLLHKMELMRKGEDVSSLTIKTELPEKGKLKGKAKQAAKARAKAPAEEEKPETEKVEEEKPGEDKPEEGKSE